jgi:hypothetical protein
MLRSNRVRDPSRRSAGMVVFVVVSMTAVGTFATSTDVRYAAAFGGKADISDGRRFQQSINRAAGLQPV